MVELVDRVADATGPSIDEFDLLDVRLGIGEELGISELLQAKSAPASSY